MDQGTNVFSDPLKAYLRVGYFKPEPRKVLYWVAFIRELSRRVETYGKTWEKLLPPGLSNKLIADYIKDPRGMIAAKRFTLEEIEELRQPQRILLFYFIRRLSNYYAENQKVIKNINTEIAETIFQLYPKPAVPDRGYITLGSEDGSYMEVLRGALMECIVEGEQITRIYETDTNFAGYPLTLNRVITASPEELKNNMIIREVALPLTSPVNPFRPAEADEDHTEDRSFTPALIVSSALLCVREGKRTIQLSMNTENVNVEDLEFQLTTSEGWMTLPQSYAGIEVTQPYAGSIRATIRLSEECPPISPLDNPLDVEQYLNNHSAVRFGSAVPQKEGFRVTRIELDVQVEGLFPEAIRNQEQVLSQEEDFQPFGVDAELQSAFTFTDAELMHPELKEISIYPEWVAVPGNLDEYYAAYGKTREGFKVNMYTATKAPGAVNPVWTDNGIAELFTSPILLKPKAISASDTTCVGWDEEETDPINHSTYYRLELVNQDFGQSEYPLLITNYAIEYGVYESRRIKWFSKKPLEVNKPYIPLWSALKVNYSSNTVSWTPGTDNSAVEVFKSEPIGYQKYDGESVRHGSDFFGVLYLGFLELTGETFTTLFHGSTGNPRARNSTMTWWYLGKEDWVPLTDYIVDDGTHGYTETGILSWIRPEDISRTNPMMPTGYYWLKLTIHPDEKDAFPLPPCRNQKRYYWNGIMTLNGLETNVMKIVRQEAELEESGNVSSLPAGSSISFINSNLDYSITLPYNTFGEVPAETHLDFWVRAFNQVRNRGRMVQGQDYEDILLRDNRELALVKAIPRSVRPDSFSIVVVGRQVYDKVPYDKPEIFSAYGLNRYWEQVVALSSPFIGPVKVPPQDRSPLNPQVINPCYTEIGFRVFVQFTGENTFTEDHFRLFSDLQRFVNPWRYEMDVSLQFGCWFDYSGIVSYVQGLSYVDVLYGIELGIMIDRTLVFEGSSYVFYEDEILVLNSPEMVIIADEPEGDCCPGIGNMIIGEDFIVCSNDCKENRVDEQKMNENE